MASKNREQLGATAGVRWIRMSTDLIAAAREMLDLSKCGFDLNVMRYDIVAGGHVEGWIFF